MANYYASARSNYFKVKNDDEFLEFCRVRGLEVWSRPCLEENIERTGARKEYAIAPSDQGDGNGWCSGYYDENEQDYIDVALEEELPKFLDGSVCVLQECGAEKLRYLTGYAVAIHPDGRVVTVNIHDIYKKAAKAFGKDILITSCTY